MKKLALLTASFAVLVFGIVSVANAQEEGTGRLDLTVSPPVIELTAKPGQQIQERFRVRNNLDTPVELEISVRRLTSDPTDGNPVPEDEANGEELSWVSFDTNEFTAPPLEWQDITFTIDIPESAAYGYYYVFRITPKDDAAFTSTGAEVKGELLVVTLLNVQKEGSQSKTELVSFKPRSFFNEYLPTEFTVKLANKGNVHVKPVGNIFITRGGGKELAILEVNPGIGSILPGGTREFESSWNDGFLVKEAVVEDSEPKLDAQGNPVTKLAINWNKLTDFRIGPYEARLLMVYDDGSKDATIEGVATFWVIPYTALGIILVVIIGTVVVLRFALRMYVKREVSRSKK